MPPVAPHDRAPAPVDAVQPVPPGVVGSITFDFNRISPSATGNADHGFLTFHMVDGTSATLGGHPTPQTGGDGLIFVSGLDVRDPHQLTASFELHPPPGTSMTEYAHQLTQAAANYNTHPLPYDALGEDGYNSTSLASSAIAHVGGATGVRDLQSINREIGIGEHLRTANAQSIGIDIVAIDAIAQRTRDGLEVATGIDHASIPADRFARGSAGPLADPVSPPQLTAYGALSNLPSEMGKYVGERAVELSIEARRALGDRPSTFSYERDGRPVSTGSYTQTGRILEVNNDYVVQSTGRGVAVYPRAEMELSARDRSSLDAALVPGNSVSVNFSNGVLDVSASQELGRNALQR